MGYNGCMFVFCADGPPSPFPAADDVHSVWHQPVGQHVPCLWIKHIKPSTVLAYDFWKSPSKGMIHARWQHMTPFYDSLWLFVQFGWFMALWFTNVYHMASIYQLYMLVFNRVPGFWSTASHHRYHRQGKHQVSPFMKASWAHARYSFEMHAPLSAEDQRVSAAAWRATRSDGGRPGTK